jgi:hypothetical protein
MVSTLSRPIHAFNDSGTRWFSGNIFQCYKIIVHILSFSFTDRIHVCNCPVFTLGSLWRPFLFSLFLLFSFSCFILLFLIHTHVHTHTHTHTCTCTRARTHTHTHKHIHALEHIFCAWHFFHQNHLYRAHPVWSAVPRPPRVTQCNLRCTGATAAANPACRVHFNDRARHECGEITSSKSRI